MKIENIIEDLIEDMIDIRQRLETLICNHEPHLNFSIDLPGLEKLSPIKIVELTTREDGLVYIIRAEIHTQNGNRVFEHSTGRLSASLKTDDEKMQRRHKWFLEVLRETIKKRKKDNQAASRIRKTSN